MIKKYFILFIILVAALMVRLYKIDSPIADWHSWRQADTASVTRVFAQEGVNLLIPRYQDISFVLLLLLDPIFHNFPSPNEHRKNEQFSSHLDDKGLTFRLQYGKMIIVGNRPTD